MNAEMDISKNQWRSTGGEAGWQESLSTVDSGNSELGFVTNFVY